MTTLSLSWLAAKAGLLSHPNQIQELAEYVRQQNPQVVLTKDGEANLPALTKEEMEILFGVELAIQQWLDGDDLHWLG